MRWWILLYTYAVLGSLVDGESVVPNDFPVTRRIVNEREGCYVMLQRSFPFNPESGPNVPRLHRRANDVHWCGWIGIHVFAACHIVTDGTLDRNN